MEKRMLDAEITLIPYSPREDVALAWYQDPEVCRQVDGTASVYTPERLRRMYEFLSSHGQCYYIEYLGQLVGDVSLRDSAEVCIVVCREYQNRHIGRRCIRGMLSLAKEKGLREVRARIYPFNTQSQRMFESVGFRREAREWFVYPIT